MTRIKAKANARRGIGKTTQIPFKGFSQRSALALRELGLFLLKGLQKQVEHPGFILK